MIDCVNEILGEASAAEKPKPTKRNLKTTPKESESNDFPLKSSKIPEKISDEERQNIEIIVELLEPLADLTNKFQADYVTSALVIPGVIHCIQGTK